MKKSIFIICAICGLICVISGLICVIYDSENGFKMFQLYEESSGEITRQGLIQIVFSNPEFTGVPKSIRLDHHPGFYHDSRKPFSCIWYGYLFVDSPGEYRIGTLSDDGSWVYIDNKLVIDNGGEHGPQFIENTINLTSGLHPLEIRYFDKGGISCFKLYWGRKEIWPFHTFIPKRNLLHLDKNWKTVSLENLKEGIDVKGKVYLITYLKIPMEGDYTLRLESNCPIEMNIKRNQVSSEMGKIEKTVTLRKKEYPLVVTMNPPMDIGELGKPITLTLPWQTPDGKTETIPERFLIAR